MFFILYSKKTDRAVAKISPDFVTALDHPRKTVKKLLRYDDQGELIGYFDVTVWLSGVTHPVIELNLSPQDFRTLDSDATPPQAVKEVMAQYGQKIGCFEISDEHVQGAIDLYKSESYLQLGGENKHALELIKKYDLPCLGRLADPDEIA